MGRSQRRFGSTGRGRQGARNITCRRSGRTWAFAQVQLKRAANKGPQPQFHLQVSRAMPGQASPVAAAVTSQGWLLFRRPPTKPQPRSQSPAGNASANAFPLKGPRTRLQPRQITLHRLSPPSGGVAPTAIGWPRLPRRLPKVPAPKLQPSTTGGSTRRLVAQPQAPLGLAVRGGRREATQRAPAPQTSVHQPHPHGPLGGLFDLTSCLFLLPSPFLITQYPPPHGLPDRRGGRIHATASRRPRAFLQPGCLPCT